MLLELRIAGPGLDTVRLLRAGDAELILGRDAECGVCLPDPQRNVSRRHLAVRNDAGQLHFHVLSIVNGVEMPFGEAPPGAQGVLPPGQVFRVGDYSIGVAQVPDGTRARANDDPFADWGFDSPADPRATHAVTGSATLPGSIPGDMARFFEGLGLDPDKVGPIAPAELEAIGAIVREAVVGLLDLRAQSIASKEHLRAEDRTLLAARDDNPLDADWPLEAKLNYLFGGHAASTGFVNPARAVQALLSELLAHDVATRAAAQATVEGVLREFEPDAMKARLLGRGGKLFERGRAWDAYVREYSGRADDLAQWARSLLDKYFAEPYLRESQQARRRSQRPRR